MRWVGISTGRRVLRMPQLPAIGAIPLYPVGTLLIEVSFNAEGDQRQTVVELNRHTDWPRFFRITIGSGGDLLVQHRQADAVTNARLAFPKPDQDAVLRIAMSWHAPERIGLLSVENLSSGEVQQSAFRDPLPWPADDLATLIAGASGCQVDPSVTLLAVSSRVEPVGFVSGFAGQTLVDTLVGPKPASTIRAGDLLQTADQGMMPVRHVIRQTRPARGHFAPVRLRAPFFGLNRDLVVAPDHRLLIAGVDAEYLFGSDSVLVEARHLAKMAAYPRQDQPATITYVQFVMDAHVCLSAQGTWAESLYLGDLADHPARHATSPLAAIPADALPRQRRMSSPELQSYEAMVLVSAMCA